MARTAGPVLLRSLVLALGACAVGPTYVRPEVPLPATWSVKGDPRLSAQRSRDQAWWRGFNDPTLDRLIELAHRQNLPLQVAGLRILEARAQLGVAFGEQFPQVQAAVGSVSAVGLSKHAANSVILDRRYWNYQAGFDAAWELDLWGKYRRGVRAEEASYLASIADYHGSLISLTAEVARTYATIRTFEVLLDQAHQNVAVQEEGLKIAESRFRNGATSELDVAQATTLLESTRASIPPLQSSLEQTRNALCTLLGQPTDCARSLLTAGKGIPTPPAQVEVELPASLLQRRPDIRLAELRAMAQCHRIGVAKADFYPRLTLFGSIGTQTSSSGGMQSGSSSIGDLFSPASLFYSVGPGLFFPLFNYGRITNNVRVQDARLQQLLVDYRHTVIRAAQEVEDGLAGFLRAQEAVGFGEKAAAAAEQAVKLALVQYREGAVDYQRVLDAQRSLLQQQQDLARIRSSVATSLIALYKALGGGWELRQGQPYVDEGNLREMGERTNWGDYLAKPPTAQPSHGSPPTHR